MRYFGGLTIAEVAQALGMSIRGVERNGRWRKLGWLKKLLDFLCYPNSTSHKDLK
ncbi:MAG: hypothetical protein IPJ30_26490 [Acidobacteria bacterium]|nr:hypothetical protein [Acidobacteriota bacterium]